MGSLIVLLGIQLLRVAATVPQDILKLPPDDKFGLQPHRLSREDWTRPPDRDESGNLVFASVNGLLRHWPNALYRNGHNIIPGTVRPGTLLYHGATDNTTGAPPERPDWVSFDQEHSYGFSSRVYTFQVTRPLKVLYFDGSSAANMPSGTIDTQEILMHGVLKECEWMEEFTRLVKLCQWGKQFGIDGFMRMEFDFEIMICDFTKNMEVVSALDLLPVARGGHRSDDENLKISSSAHLHIPDDFPCQPKIPPPFAFAVTERAPKPPAPKPPPGWKGTLRPGSSWRIASIQAGNRHNYPGLTGVDLDYTRIISFYDPKYQSLVIARRAQRRGGYRVGNITTSEAILMQQELESLLLSWDGNSTTERVDWPGIVQYIVERHVDSLEYLQTSSRVEEESSGWKNVTDSTQRTRWQLLKMLAPHMTITTVPSAAEAGQNGTSWLMPMIDRCRTVYTRSIPTSNLTSSELLLKSAVEVVAGEICRTLGLFWLKAFDIEGQSQADQENFLRETERELSRLIDWLGWTSFSRFSTCEPACGIDETCTLPQWPFEIRWGDGGTDELPVPFCLPMMIV